MRKYVYADESGNFDFSPNPKASKYFILTTVLMTDHKIASALFDLRRQLEWIGFNMRAGFHASEDKQKVRDAVFQILRQYSFRVDATIIDKRKTQPQLRQTNMRFYQYAWYYHMKYVTPRIATNVDEIMVVAATIATKKKEAAFSAAIEDVMDQVSPTNSMRNTLWPAASDPCLQIADYCSWAIQRKWEIGDDRSYKLINGNILSEYNLFSRGNVYYY